MANLEQIVDDLSSLTVLEAAELSKMLEEKLFRFSVTFGAKRMCNNALIRWWLHLEESISS